MGNLPLLFMFLVPDASARFQGCAVHCCGTSVEGPGVQYRHQVPPKAADQAGQMLGQGRQAALPGAAGRQTALLVQEPPHLPRHVIVLGEKGE